jgi:membrane associated rhomboid family serine protease
MVRKKSPWLLRTPLVSLLTPLGLIAIHAVLANRAGQGLLDLGDICAPLGDVCYEFATVPVRFFAEPGSMNAYPNILAQLFSLVTSGLLHANWLHVLSNSLVIWQFGVVVARALGPGIMPAAKWMLLFVVSAAAGSLTYLLISDANVVLLGASGAASGLIGASFLVDWEGRVHSPLSRRYLILTAMFAAMNVALVLAGPALLGMAVSWEAHAGGYVAGTGIMLILGRKIRAVRAA